MTIKKKQGELAIVERIKIVDDIEMGVTSDGTPFLTQRGLANICRVAPSVITEWAGSFDPDATKGRDAAISRFLAAHGYDREYLYEKLPDGSHAYPDLVCMAVLEYYAFESNAPNAADALRNYRALARAGLRLFIYRQVGYDPAKVIPSKWREFHDRMLLNRVPNGYFSAFREISDVCIDAINAGLKMDSHTIPDISVGIAWAAKWKDEGMDAKYGPRKKHPHQYPDYFPQAVANAFIEASIYPIAALGEFRDWLQTVYLPQKYPTYLDKKVKAGALPASAKELLLAAVNPEEDAAQ